MIFNYKRVSTTDQNTERQLLNIACDRAYIEKISGKNTDRPELQAMLLNIRAGDVVNVHSMDRLARNTKDLLNLVEEITAKGAKIVFHKENLTFAPIGKTHIKNDDDDVRSSGGAGTEPNIGTPKRGNCPAKLHGNIKAVSLN